MCKSPSVLHRPHLLEALVLILPPRRSLWSLHLQNRHRVLAAPALTGQRQEPVPVSAATVPLLPVLMLVHS